jgi:hypothetical protein
MSTMKRSACRLAAAALVVVATPWAVADPVQWTVESGGNGHWYELVQVPNGIGWAQAGAAAEASGGYLATLTSAPENSLAFSLADVPAVWYIDIWGSHIGPWIGGYLSGNTWTWVNGEGAFSYTAWSPGEPNNFGGGEARAHLFSNGTLGWNDIPPDTPIRGYLVEWTTAPVPEPANFGLMAAGLAGVAGLLHLRRRR